MAGNMPNLDFEKLGLKCGLEIHQQLNTKKLFCNCSSEIIEDKPDFEFRRKLIAIEGESGKVDAAAREEQIKDKYYIYHFHKGSSCLVEMDEEPPHDLNQDALDVVLQFAKAVDAKIIPKVQVMRKTVVDGSNTSGFQRTALVGVDGRLEINGKKYGVDSICIEEDACKIVERKADFDVYNLSRLGIPLIEIATDPSIRDPDEARTVAEQIGMILRSTGKVKRGIGTIRQDVNVSIKEGVRIEIKGVQELKIIPVVVEYEALRQVNLNRIYSELSAKSFEFDEKIYDITALLSKTASKILRMALDNKGMIYAIRLPGHKGIIGREIQPGRRYGTELADYAKTKGVKGLFHSDELPNYGITDDEVALVRKELKCGEDDGFIMIADKEKNAFNAITAVLNRAKELRLIKEVRNANPDGTSSYMRPMPGAARMYPETDVKPIIPDVDAVEMPELISDKIERFKKDYDLNDELAPLVVKSDYDEFEDDVKKYPNLNPSLMITSMLITPKEIKKRENLTVDAFEIKDQIFDKANNSEVAYESLKDIIFDYARTKVLDFSKFKAVDEEELEAELKKIVNENKGAPVGALMGLAMAKFRGKVPGKIISEKLNQLLSK